MQASSAASMTSDNCLCATPSIPDDRPERTKADKRTSAWERKAGSNPKAKGIHAYKGMLRCHRKIRLEARRLSELRRSPADAPNHRSNRRRGTKRHPGQTTGVALQRSLGQRQWPTRFNLDSVFQGRGEVPRANGSAIPCED